jgi:hypothetical protein
MAGFLAVSGKSHGSKECVVADAVVVEPVSLPAHSLLTGKLTGNSVVPACISGLRRPMDQRRQSLAAKFPTHRNREFIAKNRESSLKNKEFG